MSILISVLKKPSLLNTFDVIQWQQLLLEANISQLTGRIYYLIDINQFQLPDYIEWHLESAYKIAQKQRKQAIREFYEVTSALAQFKDSIIFLKGAAYIAKDLPCSYGRTFSDIDVLVKKENLSTIEQILKFSGWVKNEIDDYDEKYYRTWMHEIPPLVHSQRGTVLDVHHNILPSTNKNMPDVSLFNKAQVNVLNVGNINTLDDIDLCIHTAVHLFTESEFHHGLRDISDIHLLLCHFDQNSHLIESKNDSQNNFIIKLIQRSKFLGLYDYIRLAIRYSHLVFNTPLQHLNISDLEHKNKFIGKIQDFCFLNIFQPNLSQYRNWKMKLAMFLLYWRGHLIRMPLHLLLPHLTKKLIKRFKEIFTKQPDDGKEIL